METTGPEENATASGHDSAQSGHLHVLDGHGALNGALLDRVVAPSDAVSADLAAGDAHLRLGHLLQLRAVHLTPLDRRRVEVAAKTTRKRSDGRRCGKRT